MKPKFLLLAALLLTTLYSCMSNPAEGTDEPLPIMVDEDQVVKGMISIKFDAQAAESIEANLSAEGTRAFSGMSPLESLHESLNIIRMERSFPYAGRFEKRTREAGLHRWYDIYFEEGVTVTRAANEFNGLPGVEIVEPQRVATLLAHTIPPLTLEDIGDMINTRPVADDVYPFDDPRLSDQWHYYNDGSVKYSIAGADINVIDVWKTQSGHPDVIVSIVDGGLDYNHEDLKANYWLNTAELNGVTGEDDDDNGYVDDIYGWNFVTDSNVIEPYDHGVHVGGTVAAVNNNGIGVAGIAGGNGTPDSGVKIMSCQVFMSDGAGGYIGGGMDRAIKYGADNGAVISQNSWTSGGGMTEKVRDAIDYFIQHAGIDENGNQEGPMKGGIVIFGAANDNTSIKSYPASYDKVLAVASMGSNYKRAYYSNFGDWVDITAPGGDYYTGGVGSPREKSVILSTMPNNAYGYMQGTSMACPHVSGIAALMVAQNGVGQPGYTPEQLWEELLASAEDIDKYNPNYANRLGAGYVNAYKAVFANEGFPPDKVTDLEAQWGVDKVTMTWSIPADEDDGLPSRFSLYLSTSPINNGDAASATVSVGPNAQVGDKMTWVFQDLQRDTRYYVGVAGIDVRGFTAQIASVEGKTLSNRSPILISNLEGIFLTGVNSSATLNLNNYFEDPDGDKLVYTAAASTPNIVTTRVENNNLIITSMTNGSVDITVTATDSLNESVTATFNVFVSDESKSMYLYPNPVSDRLNIRMGSEVNGTSRVKLYNSTGILAYNGEIAVKPGEASTISVVGLAPGAYTVTVTFNGITYRERIVKI